MPIEHILIVDDSATDRFFLTELLETDGYEVSTADSGEVCLDVLREMTPDLIICDIVMPGLSGFEVLRAITKNPQTKTIPVILCTGKSKDTDQIWAQKMGAKTCITKPVDELELLNLLDEMA